MGRLVPFDEPWRFGADEATALHVPFRASIADVNVEPGWYTLYAIPDEEEWRIVINGQTQSWGIPIDDAVRSGDIGSGVVAVERTDAPVEFADTNARARLRHRGDSRRRVGAHASAASHPGEVAVH